ncbi:AMP-binding protein [Nocardioides sp. W7]|uniref:(2,3-dihydroxybenzoyl)adenylate synthase n=1 Tax=Nocardioides sp. W7 TaxID=2931390 RepID=UPI001FD58EB1|nr:AMP-binding protein [Nocardioides sp. W7]
MTPRSPLLPVTLWPADAALRYRRAGYWQPETLDSFLVDRAARFGDRVALVGARAATPGVVVELTYDDLVAEVGAWAGWFGARGVVAGDRVVVQLPNTVDFVVSIFACFRLGALPVFALPAHREHEIGHFLRLTDAAAHVVAGTRWGHDFAGMSSALGAHAVLDVEDPPASPAPHVSGTVPTQDDAEQVAFLQVSGGTTGTPKLIPRTHADYLYSVRESATICEVTADTTMLVALPAAHNFAMSSPGILGVLDRGGSVVLAPDPSPRTAFALIETHGVTMASLVPPLLQAWLSTARRTRADLGTLDVVQVGGARLADSVAARVAPVLGARVQQVFGMAEGLVNYTRLDDPDELVTTTQGRPISPDDEVLVVDDHDVPVAAGEEGHLLTRGPYTIRGYYGIDAEHDRSFTSDGFYRTGDLVRRLPSGHLQVTGRAKDQVNRGGDKIAIEEIENLLLTHPAVHDAALVGVPDEYLGERSCAFVVPEDGTDLTADELRRHLRGLGLAAYKIPDDVRLVASFPSTGVGKTSRQALRRSLLDHLPSATTAPH